MNLPTLSMGEFDLVYNMLSLAIAAMFASFAFFVMARQQLTSKYRPAMIMSSLVVGIAGCIVSIAVITIGYHTIRITIHTRHQWIRIVDIQACIVVIVGI